MRGTTAWPSTVGWRWRGVRWWLGRRQLDERRRGDADGFADGAGAARGLGAQHKALAGLIDGDLLDPVEVAPDVVPSRPTNGEKYGNNTSPKWYSPRKSPAVWELR